jgi:hypothetical protein
MQRRKGEKEKRGKGWEVSLERYTFNVKTFVCSRISGESGGWAATFNVQTF